MQRLRIFLHPTEVAALEKLAEREVRPVIDQARVLLRAGLREAGLLEPDLPTVE